MSSVYPYSGLYPLSGLIPFVIVNLGVCVISVGLRCWTKVISRKSNFSLDDWLAFASLVCTFYGLLQPLALVLGAMVIWLVGQGVGKHVQDVNLANVPGMLKVLYAAQILWVVDTSLIRLSALAFYGRIFHARSNTHRTWKLVYYTVSCICILWLAALFIFEAFFVCSPIAAFWEDPVGHCVDPYTTYLVGSIGNFITDLIILFLPLPQVLKLQVRAIKKLTISLSFMLGYGVAFISLGRLISSVQLGRSNTDVDWSFYLVPLFYWDSAEVGISVLAICLPAIFQLSRHGKQYGPRSLLRRKTVITPYSSSQIITGRKSQEGQRLWQPEWDNLYDTPVFGTYVNVSAGGAGNQPLQLGARSRHGEIPLSQELEGINVRQDIEIQETRLGSGKR